ncbi:MAG: M23 family metallopeptidase [Desulfovibrio sp.]|nr:M23 family metallopeptidase [Desulfovibrio sp.]
MRFLLYSIIFVTAFTLVTKGDAQSEPLSGEDVAQQDNCPSKYLPDTELSDSPSPQQPDSPSSSDPPPSHPESIPEDLSTERIPQTDAQQKLPPLRSLITSPFGPRAMPGWLGRGGKPLRMHYGIDIRARIGWPVVSFKDGTVKQAGPNGSLGLAVVIHQKDGMTAYYGHLGKVMVNVGQSVTAGTIVGHVGCTGRTTGVHLHFSLHKGDGTAVNPLPFLERAEQLLRPTSEQIPAVLEAQACHGPVVRGRNGLPVRMNRAFLRQLDSYTPPPIPAWNSR